jgi:GGDEF domain-containing protein
LREAAQRVDATFAAATPLPIRRRRVRRAGARHHPTSAVLAERIRLAVCETPLELQPGVQLGMTVSIGVAGTILARDEADLKAAAEALAGDADSALVPREAERSQSRRACLSAAAVQCGLRRINSKNSGTPQ